VKDLPIEEIEKRLLAGDTPAEKIAEMTKNEKYLAVSEGHYMLECQAAEKVSAELESLKKEVERTKTLFIPNNPNPTQTTQALAAAAIQEEENFEPIEFGKTPIRSEPSAIPPVAPIVPSNEVTFDAVPKSDGLPPLSPLPPLESAPLGGGSGGSGSGSDPFGQPLSSGVGGFGAGPTKNSAELRRHAQSIVSKVVSDVNVKADGVPDDVAVMKEQELLKAVIQELQEIQSKEINK
jgi:hypothetical protein